MTNVILPWDEQPGQPVNVNHVMENDEAVRDYINGPGNIDNAKLASPNTGVWKTVFKVTRARVFGNTASGLKVAANGNTQAVGDATSTGSRSAPIWVPNTADVAVNGMTTQGRLVVYYAVNAVAPGITLTAGINNVLTTLGGALAGQLSFTVAAASATAAIVAPGAGTTGNALSSTFTFGTLAVGLHIFTVNLSGTVAANSHVTMSMHLQVRHV